MLEMMVFALTLVVAQIVAGVVVLVLSMKLMGSKWFAKKYMAYFMKMVENFNLVEEEENDQEEGL